MEIQPQHVNLDTLFHRRLFRIPQYQRAYSWERKHRDALFDDISRSYAAGNGRSHFMATIVGLRRDMRTIVTDQYHIVDIVDGQQRLTTLILLYKAVAKALNRSIHVERSVAEEIDKMLIKPDDVCPVLLQTNHDASECFSHYLRTGRYPQPSTATTLAQRAILSAVLECEQFVQNWLARGSSLISLIMHLKSKLTFILHEIGDESLVYSVFEILNSRGMDVSWFDRLKSMLMAVVFETQTGNQQETIDEIQKLWSDIYRTIGLRLGLSTESLRFAATLRTKDCPNRALSEEDAVGQLLEQSENTSIGAIEVTNWIKSVTEAVDALVADRRNNAVTKIIHARLVAVAIILREDLNDSQVDRALRRWENVTFRIFGMYGRDTRTGSGMYVRFAWRVRNEKLKFGDIMKGISKLGEEYPIDDAVQQLVSTDCYSGWREELRYFLYAYEENLSEQAGQRFNNEQWNRIWASNAAESIEHVVPQSSGKRHIHWLGNLVLLPPELNAQLGAIEPAEKCTRYTKTGLFIAQEVGERISMVKKWNEGEIRRRERKLVQWAVKRWAD